MTAESLMPPLDVIPLKPLSNGGSGFGEAAEAMLPDTLFLEAEEEAVGD